MRARFRSDSVRELSETARRAIFEKEGMGGAKPLKLVPLQVTELAHATGVDSVTNASSTYVFIQARAPMNHCFLSERL